MPLVMQRPEPGTPGHYSSTHHVAPDLRVLAFCSLLAFLATIPRILSPQFGLLDDGVTYVMSRALAEDPSRLFLSGGATGRFRVNFDLYYAALYTIGGDRPVAYFVANGFLAAATGWVLAHTLLRLGLSAAATFLGVATFVLSAGFLEAFYTLSKAEPLQLFLVMLAISLLLPPGHRNPRYPSLLYGLSAAVALLAAMLTKETSVALLPVAATWWALNRILQQGHAYTGGRAPAILLVASLTAFFGFMVLWIAVGPTPPLTGTYASNYSLTFGRLTETGLACFIIILHQFPQCIPLSSFLIAQALPRCSAVAPSLPFVSAWLVGWTAVFAPWLPPLGYHALPLGVGAALISGLGMTTLAKTSSHKRKWWLWLLLVASGTLSVAGAMNGLSAGRMQLMLDEVNARLLDRLAALPKDALVRVALPAGNEYVFEIGLHLEQFKGRPDIRVEPWQPPDELHPSPDRPTFLVVPHFENGLSPGVRCAVNQSYARWLALNLPANLDRTAVKVWHHQETATLPDLGLFPAVCKITGRVPALYCRPERPIFVLNRFLYGWTIYQLGCPSAALVADTRGRHNLEAAESLAIR